MELKTMRITFFPKKSKAATGHCYLYMRITLDGNRKDISTGYELNPDEWEPETQSMRPKHKDIHYVAKLINQYRMKALTAQQEMAQLDLPYNVNTICDRLKGTEDGKLIPTLMELFKKQIQRKRNLGGATNTPATIQKYRRCMEHLKDFTLDFTGLEDISLSRINLQFIEDFEMHLKKNGKCSHNTTMKYIQTFKTIFRQGIAHGWVKKDPFQTYKIRMMEVVRDYLTEDEIQALLTEQLPPTRHRHVRDIFLFSCFTGLAYIDVACLQVKNIHLENGKYWIRTRRQKTNVKSNIPLLEIPMGIIRKLHPDFEESDPDTKLFSIISNQKMNEYLKELASIVGIKKQLTFHIARHTFATTVTLNNGVPIESVSSMLGHKNITTTQHYAKLLDKKLEADMERLSQRLNFTTHD